MAKPPIAFGETYSGLPSATARLFKFADESMWEFDEARRKPPLIRLWDGDWNLAYRVDQIAIEAEFQWKLNDTGHATVVLPLEHEAAQWALDFRKRPKRNVHVTADVDGARWSGVVKAARLIKEDSGRRYVQLEVLHDYEMLKRIYCWPNPFLTSHIQFPRSFVLAGPTEWVLKTALWSNLYRMYGALWAVPDNPLDAVQWARNKLLKDWPIVVKPTPSVVDLSQPWTIFSSRMKTWHEASEAALADAQMYVECRRWLQGDPEPWPGADLRHGALVVDIIDKSAVYSAGGAGLIGDLLLGFQKVVTRVGESGLDNVVNPQPRLPVMADRVPEYNVPGFLGTISTTPYVVYRDGPNSGLRTADFTYEPATASQFITGGQSMGGVNEGISAAIQAVGNTMGQFVFVPTAGTIADTFLKPIYEDTILAWMFIKSFRRSAEIGWSRWMEYFVEGADKAYTLSSIVALRKGYWETRERFTHSIEVDDGSPWYIGDQGKGDFFLGDRIASTVIGLDSNSLVVERVSELKYKLARDSRGWSATVGDFQATESALDRVIRSISKVGSAAHDLGVQ